MKLIKALATVLTVAVFTSGSAQASPADLTGTRTSSGLLAPDNNQIDKVGLIGNILSLPYSIDWEITQTGNNYNYVYSFSNLPILGLSLTQDRFFIESGGATAADLQNVRLDSSLVLVQGSHYQDAVVGGVSGILFDVSGLLGIVGSIGEYDLEFDVAAAPVWGDFAHDYATSSLLGLLSGGVRNANFGDIPPAGAGLPGYVASIGQVTVPEPSTYALLGTCMLLVAYAKRRREQAQVQA